METKIYIKPMSVNDAWKGKRYKTDEYKIYEKEVLYKLKKMKVPEGKLSISILFGFSSKKSDWDNPIKCFVDILQKKYGFDDNQIYRGVIEKTIVPKGEEFIEFEIESYAEDMQ